MGKNALTSWLVITAKDFKVLIKNKFLFLIYCAVGLGLLFLALFVKFVVGNLFGAYDAADYLPHMPNYILYFVIFTSSLYMMSQGAVSFTDELESGTADRLITMNVGALTIYFGKFVFFYLASLIHIIIYNSAVTILYTIFKTIDVDFLNWTAPSFFMYVFVWPFFMVLGAAILYALIAMIRRATKTGK